MFLFFFFLRVVQREDSSKLFSGNVNSKGSSGISGLCHKESLEGNGCALSLLPREPNHI